jgi:hypothetical protein
MLILHWMMVDASRAIDAQHQNETAGLLADCRIRLSRYSRNTTAPMPTAIAELPRLRGEQFAPSQHSPSGFLINLHVFAARLA